VSRLSTVSVTSSSSRCGARPEASSAPRTVPTTSPRNCAGERFTAMPSGAGQVAASMRSSELYIAWTHSGGPGAQPAVAAQLREPVGTGAELVEILFDFAAELWRAFTRSAAPTGVARPTD